MKVYRQGDIILERVDKVPGGYILAATNLSIKGETGNAHVLEAKVYRSSRSKAEGNPRTTVKVGTRAFPVAQEYVVVDKDSMAMTHTEHPALPIERGTYRIRRVRTFTPERPRLVND